MYDEALEAVGRAWELLQEPLSSGEDGAREMAVAVLESRAFTRAEAGDESSLTDIDAAINFVRTDPAGGNAWKVADLIDSRGRAQMSLERREEAVAAFLQAADGYADTSDLLGAARAVHFAAQNLAGPLERAAEAVPIFRQALTQVDAAVAAGAPAGDLRESIIIKLAETLDGLGEGTEAAAVRGLLA
jgi:tetratricopeptide (TPR) repeat protein